MLSVDANPSHPINVPQQHSTNSLLPADLKALHSLSVATVGSSKESEESRGQGEQPSNKHLRISKELYSPSNGLSANDLSNKELNALTYPHCQLQIDIGTLSKGKLRGSI